MPSTARKSKTSNSNPIPAKTLLTVSQKASLSGSIHSCQSQNSFEGSDNVAYPMALKKKAIKKNKNYKCGHNHKDHYAKVLTYWYQ